MKLWTQTEKETLRNLYKLHAAPEIARIMGKTVVQVYSAIARNNISKGDDFFMSNQVIALCRSSPGLTCVEIADRLRKDYDNVRTAIRRMLKTGEICRVGKGKNFRYYADKAAADVAQEQAIKAHAEHVERMRCKKQEARNEARRLQREKAQKKAQSKPKKVTDKKPETIRITSHKKQPSAPVNAVIVWPEHVAVQVIPTPPPRFSFTPPPNWRGQITNDWMDRRLQQVGA